MRHLILLILIVIGSISANAQRQNVRRSTAKARRTTTTAKKRSSYKTYNRKANHVSSNNQQSYSTVEEITDDDWGVAAVDVDDKSDDIAQPPAEEEERIFTIAEQMPSFNGNVNQWLSTHISYPPIAAKNNVQGRVIVKFVVCKDGSISQAKIVRGVDPYLDAEALRVINSMPNWNPGMNNGKPANVWFTLPLTFKLQ